MMFKNLKGETAVSPHHSVSANIMKTPKNAKTMFWGDFRFLRGSWKLIPAKSER
jgi:hypothetical protein